MILLTLMIMTQITCDLKKTNKFNLYCGKAEEQYVRPMASILHCGNVTEIPS